MFSWSANRQILYAGVVLSFLLVVAGGIIYKFAYHSPTCFDTKKNGDETGVDCGGSCQLLCKSDALSPVVLWSKIFNISGDVYSAVAYVENPNATSRNPKAIYEFKIYDAKNNLMGTRTGEISIPKNKKFAVFESGFNFKNTQPKYVEFTFTSFALWVKDTEPEPRISIDYSTFLATSTVPRIEGNISNNDTYTIPTVELTAFVLDNKENVIAASQTFVDNLVRKSSEPFVFTWPKPFDFGVESCSNILDLAIILDRSGSMKSESIQPPEPFSTVLSTAESFVRNLGEDDRSGVVSFGTTGTLVSPLSGNKIETASAIHTMTLSTTTLEQTNITDGLILAQAELQSPRTRPESKKVIILLTDGIPTEPRKTGVSDYPSISALTEANMIASSSITLFTIGLGKNVSSGFLKNLATDDSHYFYAPDKSALTNIYKRISSSLCEKKPNVISVMYRIP